MSHTGQCSVRLHLSEDDGGTTKAHIPTGSTVAGRVPRVVLPVGEIP